jgi:hypothetical protein
LLWEPAIGAGNLAHTLRAEGFQITGTREDFLAKSATTLGADAICINPPFGFGGRLACKFIKHALELTPIIAMLLRIDFDSGRSRVHLFRDHLHFAQRISCCIGSCGLSAKLRSRARTVQGLFGTRSTAARRPSPTPQ